MFDRGKFLQWEVLQDVDIDTGANPSAEGGDEDGGPGEGRRVVDLIEFFKLNVRSLLMPGQCSPTRASTCVAI